MKRGLTDHPLWGLGFRPFFLAGTAMAVVWLILWLAVWNGVATLPTYYSSPLVWHGHEMLYGFTLAIIAGFLLTATQNWTGKPGRRGGWLVSLVAVWAAGRIAPILLAPWPWLVALADLAFLPLVAVALAPYLAAQRRHMIFFGILALLAIGNLLVHAEALALAHTARQGLLFGVDTVVIVILIITGRVIPFFTTKAVPGARVTKKPFVEALSIATAIVFLLAEAFAEGSAIARAIAAAACLAQLARWLGWRPWQTRQVPILWILHAGYFWLIVGFALKAVGPSLPPSLATHAFTIGGIGVAIYGMISRVALGHTGRPIVATRAVIVGYGLLNLSALIRVVWPIARPDSYATSIYLAGALWVLAFIILLVRYAPMLLSARADGHPG